MLGSPMSPNGAHTQHHPGRCPRGGYLGQVADADGHGETEGEYGSHNLEEHGDVIEDVGKKPGGRDKRSEVRGLHNRRRPSPHFQPLLTSTAWHYSPFCSCWGGQVGLQLGFKKKTHPVGRQAILQALVRSEGLRKTHIPARHLSQYPVTAA